jgi:hypothetical protein
MVENDEEVKVDYFRKTTFPQIYKYHSLGKA